MSSGYEFGDIVKGITKPECKLEMESCPPSYIERGSICMSTGYPFKMISRKSRTVCEEPTKKVAEPVNLEKAGMKIGNLIDGLKSEAVKKCRTICE